MESTLATKQYVRVFKVDRPGATLYVAVLMENQNGKEIAISEPKILKILPVRSVFALTGSTKNSMPALSGLNLTSGTAFAPIISPYVTLFGYQESGILTTLGAQPPTFA